MDDRVRGRRGRRGRRGVSAPRGSKRSAGELHLRLVGADVRRVAHHNVETFGRPAARTSCPAETRRALARDSPHWPARPPAPRPTHRWPSRATAAARSRAPAQSRPTPCRGRPLRRAGHIAQRQRPLHQQLRLRPRHQHRRAHRERQRPEIPIPHKVGERLAARAPLDQLEVPRSRRLPRAHPPDETETGRAARSARERAAAPHRARRSRNGPPAARCRAPEAPVSCDSPPLLLSSAHAECALSPGWPAEREPGARHGFPHLQGLARALPAVRGGGDDRRTAPEHLLARARRAVWRLPAGRPGSPSCWPCWAASSQCISAP